MLQGGYSGEISGMRIKSSTATSTQPPKDQNLSDNIACSAAGTFTFGAAPKAPDFNSTTVQDQRRQTAGGQHARRRAHYKAPKSPTAIPAFHKQSFILQPHASQQNAGPDATAHSYAQTGPHADLTAQQQRYRTHEAMPVFTASAAAAAAGAASAPPPTHEFSQERAAAASQPSAQPAAAAAAEHADLPPRFARSVNLGGTQQETGASQMPAPPPSGVGNLKSKVQSLTMPTSCFVILSCGSGKHTCINTVILQSSEHKKQMHVEVIDAYQQISRRLQGQSCSLSWHMQVRAALLGGLPSEITKRQVSARHGAPGQEAWTAPS